MTGDPGRAGPDGAGSTGQAAVDALVALLDLEPVGAARFRGWTPPNGSQRVYGGQVAAQALMAAGRSVDPERSVHSLHGYFVRPGDPSEPITFEVDRVRDGRSFSVRRCSAFQHGEPIFLMSASFHRPEGGLDHQAPGPGGDRIPPPQALPTMADQLARHPERLGFWTTIARPIDVRYLGEPGWVRPGDRPAATNQRAWMRIDGRLPDDPLVHACALTFASDMTLLDSVLAVHGAVWGPGGFEGASLDHALWFHRPFRADEWFLYDCWSPSAFGGRGLGTGRMFGPGGQHVASAVQEGLLRRVGD